MPVPLKPAHCFSSQPAEKKQWTVSRKADGEQRNIEAEVKRWKKLKKRKMKNTICTYLRVTYKLIILIIIFLFFSVFLALQAWCQIKRTWSCRPVPEIHHCQHVYHRKICWRCHYWMIVFVNGCHRLWQACRLMIGLFLLTGGPIFYAAGFVIPEYVSPAFFHEWG